MPEFASRLHPQATPATQHSPATPRPHSPWPQDGVTYENGPANGTTDAWTINFGYVVGDAFVPSGNRVTGFDIWVWEFPGDAMTSVDWSVTSGPNGGTVCGSGTVSGSSLKDAFISTNQYGYNIDKISATGLNVNVTSGSTYWVNLYNAAVPSGDPIYWDENSGAGCKSQGCPSQAYENAVGTIPSEAFDVVGNNNGLPYPCGYDLNESTGPSKTPAAEAQSFQVIYNFTGGDDGTSPNGLTRDQAGNFYGTAVSGGYTGGNCGAGCGTVFRLTHQGSDWILKPLYKFTGGTGDGLGPSSKVLIGPDGTLYGATGHGGTGYGTVYHLQPSANACLTGSCSWVETVLYSFKGTQGDNFDERGAGACSSQSLELPGVKWPMDGSDGAWPWGDLVSDQAGNIYGLATGGPGDRGCSCSSCGIIYKLSPSAGGWVESIDTRFNQYSGRATSGLTGIYYGFTTFIKWWSGENDWDFGGWAGMFKLPRNGSMGAFPISEYAGFFTTVYTGNDCPGGLFGGNGTRLYTGPTGTLKVADAAGNLYGIAGNTIFKMSPGDGSWKNTVVYQFTGGTDGSGPTDLILDGDGNLWGTTASGGAYDKGVIFEITP